MRAFLGVDGGSTSTKAVLLDHDGEVVAKSYQLSKGNPIEDAMEVIGLLQSQIEEQGATLEISEGNHSRTVSRDGEPVIKISYETPAARTGRTQFKHVERGYVLDIRTAEFTGS